MHIEAGILLAGFLGIIIPLKQWDHAAQQRVF
jgi:hypothetical protein